MGFVLVSWLQIVRCKSVLVSINVFWKLCVAIVTIAYMNISR